MSALVAALIGAGVAGLGSVINGQNADDGNKWNYMMNQMNNNFNERMLQKQMDYNRDMWNAQNAYNTPSAQRKRYEDAGINPYMALGNIASGNAQSAGGVNPPSASPSSPANVARFDSSGIQQAVQGYMANRIQEKSVNSSTALQDANAEQVRIENQYKAMDLVTQLYERIENTKNIKQRNAYQQMLNETYMEQFNSDMRIKQNQADLIESQVREKYFDIGLKAVHLFNLPKQYQLTFASISADVLLRQAQEKLTWEQAWHEMQKSFETESKRYGVQLNNKIVKETIDYVIERAKTEASFAPWEKSINLILGTAREAREWMPNRSKGRIYTPSYNDFTNW